MKVLVIGGGQTGYEISRILMKHDIYVYMIEKDEKTCAQLSEGLSSHIICGDAKDPQVLESAGIKSADVVIAVTENQSTNILIGCLAKIYKVKRILVRVRDPIYIESCKKLGLTEIIDPALITAQYLMAYLRGLELVEVINKIISFADVISIKISKDSKYFHKHINEISFPKGTHILVIVRENKVVLPESNIVVQENDKIILLHKKTLKESISKFFL
ncbi:MAG: potassium channel family protein [Candidatus Helarchaeota archaeon]